MKNGQDHYQAVWPWVRCSVSLILGSLVWSEDNNSICYPTHRRIPFLTVWSQPLLAPEAKALITLVAPFSSVWLPAHGELLEDPFPTWNAPVGTKSGKHRSGSLVPHRCSEHVYHLMSDDNVRYTEQCSYCYAVNLFVANNIYETSGLEQTDRLSFLLVQGCLCLLSPHYPEPYYTRVTPTFPLPSV